MLHQLSILAVVSTRLTVTRKEWICEKMYTHSILIPVFNGAKHVRETLDSALAQTGVATRVIISDDASNDDTRSILESYRSDKRVQLFYQKTNLGLFENWNFVLRICDTPTFALISQDDVFASSDAISRALEILNNDPTCGAVFCDLEFIDEESNSLGFRRFARGARFDAGVWGVRSVIQCRNLFGIPLAVSRRIINSRGFNERLVYAADLDFAIMAASGGSNPAHISFPLIKYRVHGSNATVSKQLSVLADMKLIAEANGYELSFLDKMKQRCFLALTIAARRVVLSSRVARTIGRALARWQSV